MDSFENVLSTLKNNLEYHRFYLELLEGIEIKRKKDGSHFANKNQTFVNANYNGDATHPELTVNGRDKNGKWQSYTIYCYLYADEMDKNDERLEKVVKPHISCIRDTYILTTDEIIEKIEKEKEYQKAHIASYENQINDSKQIFDIVAEKVKELNDTIHTLMEKYRDCNNAGKPIFKSSLEYRLIEYVKSEAGR